MNRTSFHGTLDTNDFEAAKRILAAWIASGDIDARIRLAGEEISHESEGFSFYAQSVSGAGGSYYLIEGQRDADPEATRRELERLRRLCAGENVSCSFEYVELNEEGEEVGDEVRLE